MRLVQKSIQRAILAAALVGAITVALLGGASAALADTPLLDAMASAGKAICNNLGPSEHPRACTEVQNDITSCSSGNVPGVYQLTQAIEATVEAAKVAANTQQNNYANASWSQLKTYRVAYDNTTGLAPYPGGSTLYYDDNAWAGVALITLYHQTGLQTYLDAAEQRYLFERTGQSDTGGLWWNTNHPYVSAGSTGGAIRLALMLYQIEGGSGKLTFAEQNYQWARQHLMTDPGYPNLYVDSPGAHSVAPAHEAWFIDDARLLYYITGNSTYRTQATNTANEAAARFGSSSFDNYSAAEFAGMFSSFVRLSSSTYTSYIDTYVSWLNTHTTDGDFDHPNAGTGCSEETKQQAGASWVFTLHGLNSSV